MMAVDQLDQARREAEWREKRRGVVPSTLLAAVMGLPGAYGSRMTAYLHAKDAIEQQETPEWMEWGKLLQRPILIRYAEKLAVPIDFVDEFDFFPDPGCKYLGASLDGRWSHGDRRCVDAKNIGFREPFNAQTGNGFGEDFSDEIPLRYHVQLHAQMACTETSVADLAVLFGGREHAIFRVYRSDEIIAAAREAATRFMEEHVLRDIPPPVDGSDEWTRFLASRAVRYKDYIDVQQLEASAQAAILRDYAKLRAAKEGKKRAESAEALYGNRLRAVIGEHSGLVLPNGRRIHFKRNADGVAENVEAELLELARRAGVDLAVFRKDFQQPKPGSRPLLLPR